MSMEKEVQSQELYAVSKIEVKEEKRKKQGIKGGKERRRDSKFHRIIYN